MLTNQAAVTAIDAPAIPGEAVSDSLTTGAGCGLETDLEILNVAEVELGDVGGGIYKT